MVHQHRTHNLCTASGAHHLQLSTDEPGIKHEAQDVTLRCKTWKMNVMFDGIVRPSCGTGLCTPVSAGLAFSPLPHLQPVAREASHGSGILAWMTLDPDPDRLVLCKPCKTVDC